MRIDTYIVSFLLACMMLVGGFLFIGANMAVYNVTMDNSSFSDVNIYVQEVYNDTEEMRSLVEGSEVTSDDAWNDILARALAAVKSIPGLVGIPFKMLNAVTDAFHIPPVFKDLFVIIFLVLIVFALIYMHYRFQNR